MTRRNVLALCMFFLLATHPTVGQDCNGNGILDLSDISGGTSEDCNTSGVPDECELALVSPGSKLVAMDAAAADEFGLSVAMSGDLILIGAWGDDDLGVQTGSAYIFADTGSAWAQQAKLVPGDGVVGDEFGRSVAISGDTAVVGSWFDDDAGIGSGSAYVFVRSGESWVQQAKLTASDAAGGDQFGKSVAIDGDSVVVGAWGNDDAGGESGAAYVFARTDGAWTQQAILTAADAAGGDQFGVSVALSGDTVIVGASLDDDSGANSGSAYVFTSSGGMWTQQAKLAAADGAAGDQFGFSVAVHEGAVVVGASLDDDDGSASGSAYVFEGSGASWSQQAKLVANDAGAGDRFGYSVSIHGDRVVVGAFGDDDAGSSSGAAYLFRRAGSAWPQQAKLRAPDAAPGDWFGVSVVVDEDAIVAGAALADGMGVDAGSAYVFPFEGDCDGNSTPDDCDIASGAPDCNTNGLPDSCDLASGVSQDCGALGQPADGVPDECQPLFVTPYMVRDLSIVDPTGQDIFAVAPFGDKVLYSAALGFENQLWISDGKPSGTHRLMRGIDPFSPGPVVAGVTAFFFVSDSADGVTLWKTDGTVGGGRRVAQIATPFVEVQVTELVAVGGDVYFVADNGLVGLELWKSDGTAAGTGVVLDILPGPSSSTPSGLAAGDGLLYMSADDGVHGREIWRTDGTPQGTQLVADIVLGATGSNPTSFTAAGGNIFFTANTPSLGVELWKTDGTSNGTELVKDINPGPASALAFPYNLVEAGGVLLFPADDGVSGREIWRSDGTSAGTVLVNDIRPGSASSSPTDLFSHQGAVFMAADDGVTGSELWRSDGSAAGTQRVADIRTGPIGSSPRPLGVSGRALFLRATGSGTGSEIWQSDGTEPGTHLLFDVNPTGSSFVTAFVAQDHALFFVADDGVHDYELWTAPACTAGNACCERGACCLADGSCQQVVESECQGIWHGVGTDCATFLCPPAGSCCAAGSGCQIAPEEACAGSWAGPGAFCMEDVFCNDSCTNASTMGVGDVVESTEFFLSTPPPLWWEFQAPTNGIATIEAMSECVTRLSMLVTEGCGGPVLVTDEAISCPEERIDFTGVASFDVVEGSSYMIRIGGFRLGERFALGLDLLAENQIRFVRHPEPRRVCVGQSVRFVVQVESVLQPSFQWLRDGMPLPQETSQELVIDLIDALHAGTYSCRVTVASAMKESDGALLEIESSCPAPRYEQVASVPLPCPPEDLASNDVDNDNDVDLAVVCQSAGAAVVIVDPSGVSSSVTLVGDVGISPTAVIAIDDDIAGRVSNCFSDGHGPGCDDEAIAACVCDLFFECCDDDWTAACAGQVDILGCAPPASSVFAIGSSSGVSILAGSNSLYAVSNSPTFCQAPVEALVAADVNAYLGFQDLVAIGNVASRAGASGGQVCGRVGDGSGAGENDCACPNGFAAATSIDTASTFGFSCVGTGRIVTERQDLVVGVAADNKLLVLRNMGSTCAEPGICPLFLGWEDLSLASQHEIGNEARAIAVADFNGDNWDDVAAANTGSGSVSILLNQGDPIPSLPPGANQTIAVGASPVRIVGKDLDGDNDVDLVVANRDSDELSILTNDGAGGFVVSATITLASASRPTGLAIADFTGDGALDIAVAQSGPGMESIVIYGASLCLGSSDLDCDGDVDLTDYAAFATCMAGPGVFSAPAGCTAQGFVAADQDSDGDVDLRDGRAFQLEFTIP